MTAVTLIELLPSEYVDVFCSVLSRGSVKTSLLGMTCPEITSFFTNCFSKFYKGDQKGLIVYIVCTSVRFYLPWKPSQRGWKKCGGRANRKDQIFSSISLDWRNSWKIRPHKLLYHVTCLTTRKKLAILSNSCNFYPSYLYYHRGVGLNQPSP